MHGRVRLSDGSPQMNIEMGLPTSLARHGVKGETSKSCDEAVHNNTAGARCCYMLTVNCICRTAARCYMYGCAVGRCTVQLCSIAIPLDVRKAGPSTSGDSAGDGSSVHSSTVRSPYPDTTAPSSLSVCRPCMGRPRRPAAPRSWGCHCEARGVLYLLCVCRCSAPEHILLDF